MSELFKDLAISTLSASVLVGSTSVTLQTGDGAKFPSPTGSDIFKLFLFNKITAEYEFVTVTSRSGDICTCSATTYAYNAGDVAENRPGEAFFNGLNVTDANIQQGTFLYGVDTGASDSYVVAMNPTATVLANGQEVRVLIGTGNTNTGAAATLKLDGLAAISITTESGNNPPSGSIKAGYVHTFVYDGTEFVLQNAGIALTALGFNAEGKKIQNVAAGTANTDAATIGGVEDFKNKTLTSPVINNPNITGGAYKKVLSGRFDGVTGNTLWSTGGFSLSRSAAGTYVVTHNLGNIQYTPVITAGVSADAYATYNNVGNNTFNIRTGIASTGAIADLTEFSVFIVKG